MTFLFNYMILYHIISNIYIFHTYSACVVLVHIDCSLIGIHQSGDLVLLKISCKPRYPRKSYAFKRNRSQIHAFWFSGWRCHYRLFLRLSRYSSPCPQVRVSGGSFSIQLATSPDCVAVSNRYRFIPRRVESEAVTYRTSINPKHAFETLPELSCWLF